ncbi:MAG: hypothetical protein WC593_07270 [Methanoregula sp.]
MTQVTRSGTCPVRCPFLYRAIVKRHAMTGSGLGCYKETGQPPASAEPGKLYSLVGIMMVQ